MEITFDLAMRTFVLVFQKNHQNHQRVRSREPSRIPRKELARILRKSRKLRQLVRKTIVKNFPQYYTKATAFQRASMYMYTCRYNICSCGKRNSFRVRLKQIIAKHNTSNSAKQDTNYEQLHADCEQNLYLSVI